MVKNLAFGEGEFSGKFSKKEPLGLYNRGISIPRGTTELRPTGTLESTGGELPEPRLLWAK